MSNDKILFDEDVTERFKRLNERIRQRTVETNEDIREFTSILSIPGLIEEATKDCDSDDEYETMSWKLESSDLGQKILSIAYDLDGNIQEDGEFWLNSYC